jgi:methionine-S-sulfoxide reductase
MTGVLRTRVGYAGGTQKDPTYHNLGNHTEAVELEFGSGAMSYDTLLDIFFTNHNPAARRPLQYTSIIFYHNDGQAKLAKQALAKMEAKLGRLYTRLEQYETFYRAEDYHQKYYLQRYGQLTKELFSHYPVFRDFVDSTAAARINGYAAGYGSVADLTNEIESFGLSAAGKQLLLEVVGSVQGRN